MDTRISSDDARVRQRLYESTYGGRAALNTPGWGTTPDFVVDPFVTSPWYGGDCTNAIEIQNFLLGYKIYDPVANANLEYPVPPSPLTRRIGAADTTALNRVVSRFDDPAFLYRSMHQALPVWEIMGGNPQANTAHYMLPADRCNINSRLDVSTRMGKSMGKM